MNQSNWNRSKLKTNDSRLSTLENPIRNDELNGLNEFEIAVHMYQSKSKLQSLVSSSNRFKKLTASVELQNRICESSRLDQQCARLSRMQNDKFMTLPQTPADEQSFCPLSLPQSKVALFNSSLSSKQKLLNTLHMVSTHFETKRHMDLKQDLMQKCIAKVNLIKSRHAQRRQDFAIFSRDEAA